MEEDYTDFSFDVFVSYSHEDIVFARKLVNWLRSAGFKVWFDEEQLVPGTRFRAGLQQGLRESSNLVAVLTKSYINRSWTQRELDLFDLTANHSERRILALEIGDLNYRQFDQVFLVHQRIKWSRKTFNPKAFWHLYCGIKNQRPGDRAKWEQNGKKLIIPKYKSAFGLFDNSIIIPVVDSLKIADLTNKKIFLMDEAIQIRKKNDVVNDCLFSPETKLESTYLSLIKMVQEKHKENALQKLIEDSWAYGKAERAAILSLASLPNWHGYYSAWAFLDISCSKIANWFLLLTQLYNPQPTEIWFSWAVFKKHWPLLIKASDKAPHKELQMHFKYLTSLAIKCNRSFKEAEADYNYGLMITPWNHFHLTWLAIRLGDNKSAVAHAIRLCETAINKDFRAGRFLTRLSNWPIFHSILSESRLSERITTARKTLGLIDMQLMPKIRDRIEKIWKLTNIRISQ